MYEIQMCQASTTRIKDHRLQHKLLSWITPNADCISEESICALINTSRQALRRMAVPTL